MRKMYSFVVLFLLQTALMGLVGVVIYTLAILIGVNGAWEVIFHNDIFLGLRDLLWQYAHPQKLLLNAAQSVPLVEICVSIIEAKGFHIGMDLAAEIGKELMKTGLLAAIMWLCKSVETLFAGAWNGLCWGIRAMYVDYDEPWMKLLISWCSTIYTITISLGATNIILLCFQPGMSQARKWALIVLLLTVGFLIVLLVGRYRGVGSVIKLMLSMICSFSAALCAILMMALLTIIVYDPAGLFWKMLLVLTFWILCGILLYISMKSSFLEICKDAKKLVRRSR